MERRARKELEEIRRIEALRGPKRWLHIFLESDPRPIAVSAIMILFAVALWLISHGAN